ncbi:pollen allergen Lol p 2-A [Sorghum bicolor]|uniref:Expansin-like CBD domain-containing protein n=1 Tax=Sorghum bicolor TaxID=4558 RepID=C5YR98_SORBI|nr:pollen allergen Lol p 2-A [Sorghum bicolor]EES16606.1 hypothetical protein SORBI_3008G028300 [Sorghum bicolor]|eukprot:XP_002442768.1 pollen allergen Lol p 2-A [Sorghum bicolor]
MTSSSSFLLVVVVLAALFAVSSCDNPPAITFTIGKDSSSTKLSFATDVAISEVAVKQNGAENWSDNLKESPVKTFTLDSKDPIKGPITIRFADKDGGYHVLVDIIPADFKAGSVYKALSYV